MQSLPRVFPKKSSTILFLCHEVPADAYVQELSLLAEVGCNIISSDKALEALLDAGIKEVVALSEYQSLTVTQLGMERGMFPEPILIGLEAEQTPAEINRMRAKGIALIDLVVIDATKAVAMRNGLKGMSHPTMDDVRSALPKNLLTVIPRAVAAGRMVVTGTKNLATVTAAVRDGGLQESELREVAYAIHDLCNGESLHLLRSIGDAVNSAMISIASSAASKLKAAGFMGVAQGATA